jgi:hypothetical protein
MKIVHGVVEFIGWWFIAGLIVATIWMVFVRHLRPRRAAGPGLNGQPVIGDRGELGAYRRRRPF